MDNKITLFIKSVIRRLSNHKGWYSWLCKFRAVRSRILGDTLNQESVSYALPWIKTPFFGLLNGSEPEKWQLF